MSRPVVVIIIRWNSRFNLRNTLLAECPDPNSQFPIMPAGSISHCNTSLAEINPALSILRFQVRLDLAGLGLLDDIECAEVFAMCLSISRPSASPTRKGPQPTSNAYSMRYWPKAKAQSRNCTTLHWRKFHCRCLIAIFVRNLTATVF